MILNSLFGITLFCGKYDLIKLFDDVCMNMKSIIFSSIVMSLHVVATLVLEEQLEKYLKVVFFEILDGDKRIKTKAHPMDFAATRV